MSNTKRENLSHALMQMRDATEMQLFIEELLTEAELSAVELRWELMGQLLDGKTQRAIAQDLHVSLCKVTRGNKILKQEGSISRRLLGEKYE